MVVQYLDNSVAVFLNIYKELFFSLVYVVFKLLQHFYFKIMNEKNAIATDNKSNTSRTSSNTIDEKEKVGNSYGRKDTYGESGTQVSIEGTYIKMATQFIRNILIRVKFRC